MILLFIFLLSATLPLAMAIYRNKNSQKRLLLATTTLYLVFSAVAFGRLVGVLPTINIGPIVEDQTVFDLYSPLIQLALLATVVFNIFCTWWIWRGFGFWRWFITCVCLYFIFGGLGGIMFGINPIMVWFGGCCAIMALTGWVLGLTYVEACVIGNIWAPALAIIASAICMMINVRNITWKFKTICYIFGSLQIFIMLILLLRYWGSMDFAFDLCIQDLRALASFFHTTYEIINIIVYFPLFIFPLLINLLLPRFLSAIFAHNDALENYGQNINAL